jgi:hypothetical protein
MSNDGIDARQNRAGLEHPVIDSDGHWIEYGPHLAKAMRRYGGDAALAGFANFGKRIVNTIASGLAQRLDSRHGQEA